MKKNILSLVLSLCCVTSITFFSSIDCYAKDILFMKNMFPAKDIITVSMNKFVADIKTKSGDRLGIVIIPLEKNIKEDSIFKAVAAGKYAMGVDCSTYYGDFMPVGPLLYGLPGDPRDANTLLDFFYEPHVDKFIQEEYGKFGVDRLSSILIGGYSLFSSKPIDNFEKLKKLRIRATGIIEKMFSSLNVDTVYIPFSQIGNSFRDDAVDVTISGSFLEHYDSGLDKYTPYADKYHLTSYQNCDLIINKEALEKLPADMQKLLRSEARKLSYSFASMTQKFEHEAYIKLKEKNVTFSRIPEFEKFYLGQRTVSSWRDYFVTDEASAKYVDMVESHLIQLGYVF